MKMWSGRFGGSLDPAFERWQRSFAFDCRLLSHELAASSAHARALNAAGVLTAEELIAILHGLDDIGKQVLLSPEFLNDEDAEDVHHFVEKRLVGLIGDMGYKLHSGRSRNEQIATDLRLYVRAAIDQLVIETATLCESLIERAEQAGNAPMPAYTHLQRAEPVLVGHWLLAYVEMLLRDASRLADCRKRLNVSPLGSGAVAGATLELNREDISEELGFEAPTANSMDATSDRDFAIEFVDDLALMALHLSRWAEEMILFSSQEYNFILLPEAYSTGSSAMPQKKNPDLLELTRAKVSRVVGNAMSLQIALKGLPLAYNKDLQEMQEPLFEATEAVMAVLPLIAGWMRAVEFNYERMAEAAQTSFMNAWAAATYLVKQNVPFRLAHEVVGKAVRLCLERNCRLEDLPITDWKALHPAFAQDIYQHLSLEAVISLHNVPGGTAPPRVREALAQARQLVKSLRVNASRGGVHAHA
jgi:argininosuccinate lyase